MKLGSSGRVYVLRSRAKSTLLLILAAVVMAFPAGTASALPAPAPGPTTRVSLSSTGAQAVGGDSYLGGCSADGRYVVFDSDAANLVSGDTNVLTDVFVRDRLRGTTMRVSVATGGAQGNGNSYDPSISSDGRYVIFESSATNLVPNDTNGADDVFIRDRITGTTVRASVGAAGAQSNGYSNGGSVSADGRYVAFYSDATNLVNGDTNGKFDIFLRDTIGGTTKRVSVNSSGVQGNDHSDEPKMSGNGRYVVFRSSATNLVAGDTNVSEDLFLRDTVTNTTTRVNVGAGGVQAVTGPGLQAGGRPSISYDGRYVAFESYAANLVANDTNGTLDVFVRDRQAGTTKRISVSSAGQQSNGYSSGVSISANGRWVAFFSVATNLVPGDTNAQADVFLRDTLQVTTRRVSLSAVGAQATGGTKGSQWPRISPDGRYVGFQSDSTNLVAGDTNGRTDVFLREAYAVIENDAPGVTFGRFINGLGAAYSGGSYTYAYSKAPYIGSRIEARFKGNRVRWAGPENPGYGKAKVYIDGVYNATVDCYNPTPKPSEGIYESPLLTDGVHTISVEMADGKNALSTGYVVVVDRFEVEGAAPSGVGMRANETNGVFTGTWIKIANNPTYTGSSYAYSYWPPAAFKYTFAGTKCAWIGPKVVYYGKADVYLDGVKQGTISQYAPATDTSFRVRVWESATLAAGTHTLEIRPLGAKDAAATGANIVVDAVDYLP